MCIRDSYNMDQLAAKAEEEGWIAEIDRWVFREACRRIPELRAYGLKRININLSPEVCEVPETVPNIMPDNLKIFGKEWTTSAPRLLVVFAVTL